MTAEAAFLLLAEVSRRREAPLVPARQPGPAGKGDCRTEVLRVYSPSLILPFFVLSAPSRQGAVFSTPAGTGGNARGRRLRTRGAAGESGVFLPPAQEAFPSARRMRVFSLCLREERFFLRIPGRTERRNPREACLALCRGENGIEEGKRLRQVLHLWGKARKTSLLFVFFSFRRGRSCCGTDSSSGLGREGHGFGPVFCRKKAPGPLRQPYAEENTGLTSKKEVGFSDLNLNAAVNRATRRLSAYQGGYGRTRGSANHLRSVP